MNTLLFITAITFVTVFGIVPNNGQYEQYRATDDHQQAESVAYYVHLLQDLRVNDSIIAANNKRIIILQKQATAR